MGWNSKFRDSPAYCKSFGGDRASGKILADGRGERVSMRSSSPRFGAEAYDIVGQGSGVRVSDSDINVKVSFRIACSLKRNCVTAKRKKTALFDFRREGSNCSVSKESRASCSGTGQPTSPPPSTQSGKS
jgi:hypothetical protein